MSMGKAQKKMIKASELWIRGGYTYRIVQLLKQVM